MPDKPIKRRNSLRQLKAEIKIKKQISMRDVNQLSNKGMTITAIDIFIKKYKIKSCCERYFFMGLQT